jgi:hypothetical protein
MSMALGSKLQLEPGSWAELAYDVCIGIAVGAMHSIWITGRWWFNHLVRPILTFAGLMAPQTAESESEENELKVVAVGYGRTGTVRRVHMPHPSSRGRLFFRCSAREHRGVLVAKVF